MRSSDEIARLRMKNTLPQIQIRKRRCLPPISILPLSTPRLYQAPMSKDLNPLLARALSIGVHEACSAVPSPRAPRDYTGNQLYFSAQKIERQLDLLGTLKVIKMVHEAELLSLSAERPYDRAGFMCSPSELIRKLALEDVNRTGKTVIVLGEESEPDQVPSRTYYLQTYAQIRTGFGRGRLEREPQTKGFWTAYPRLRQLVASLRNSVSEHMVYMERRRNESSTSWKG